MRRTNIYLDDDQLLALDQVASRRQTTRAEVVRSFIQMGLSGDHRDLHSDLRALDQSFGALSAEWAAAEEFRRDADVARADHLAKMWTR